MAVMKGFADHGIYFRQSVRIGEQRTACPQCARTKARARDEALSVRVEPDGAATWLCHRCGWKGCLREDTKAEPRPAPPSPAAKPEVAALRAAHTCWQGSKSLDEVSEIAAYLEARGCSIPPPDGDLRGYALYRHPCGFTGPCMVARVTDAVTGDFLTLHRTWVHPWGKKADIERPRLLWPRLPKKGGVVRLWPDEAVTLGLAVAEGIETALSLALDFGHAWATLDASNLAELPVLHGVDAITIAVDHDAAGIKAAKACRDRWFPAGADVDCVYNARPGGDLNDAVRNSGANHDNS